MRIPMGCWESGRLEGGYQWVTRSFQQLSVDQWLPILVGYTAIFVLPPFILLGLHQVLGTWMAGRMSTWQEKLQRAGHEALLWILGIVGLGMLLDAVTALGWLS